jgi:hypothetical protein
MVHARTPLPQVLTRAVKDDAAARETRGSRYLSTWPTLNAVVGVWSVATCCSPPARPQGINLEAWAYALVVDGDTPNETAARQLATAATSPAIAETQAGASAANLSVTRFIPDEQAVHADRELARLRDASALAGRNGHLLSPGYSNYRCY